MKVLIPDADNGHAIWVYEGLRLKNTQFHIMSKKFNPSLKYQKNIKSFSVIESGRNDSQYVEQILSRASKVKADIIIPIGEPAINAFSKKIKAINKTIATIPIPDQTIFETATNKKKLMDFCAFHNIPCPKTTSLQKIQKNENNLEFPLIVKPERGDGGKNIHIFFSKNELAKFASSKKDLTMGNYLVQEYVNGHDIDMSVLAKEGSVSAFTIQRGFIKRKNEFSASAGISFLYNQKLFNTVEKLIKLLNFTGITHIDLRYDAKNNDYKIVEMNVRFWGSLMGSIKAGVNFPYLACLAGLGKNFPVPNYENIRYIDFFAILKKPNVFINERIKLKETNLPQFLLNPLAHIINIIQRSN